MYHGRRRPIYQADQASKLGHARSCIVPCRTQKQVIGLIFPKHVVNQVRRETHLPPGLAFARMLPFDQSANDRDLTECIFEQVGAL